MARKPKLMSQVKPILHMGLISKNMVKEYLKKVEISRVLVKEF